MVPRRWCETLDEGDSSSSTIGDLSSDSAYVGMDPFVRTAITDRAHDGVYDTDTAHKLTLAARVKRGDVRSPHISKGGSRFDDSSSGGGGGAGKEVIFASF